MIPSTPELVHGLVALAETVASGEPLAPRLVSLCRLTAELLGCDRSSLFLLEGRHYRGVANFGNPEDVAKHFPRHRVAMHDPLVSAAFRAGAPVIVNDAPGSLRMHAATARAARIRAIALAPVFDESRQPMGFQTAEYNEHPGAFDEIESTLLAGVARLAGMAVAADRVEKEREELRGRLRQKERLEALGRLAAGVSHDFNNRLAVILGYTDLLRETLPTASEVGDDLDQLSEAAERAAWLTRQLLAFGRAELLEPELVDLSRVVRELAPILQRVIREDIRLDLALAESLPAVRIDPRRFEDALLNLVANARDALPDGGSVEIRTRLLGEPVPRVELAVRDDGIGMDATTLERAFDPFYTSKPFGRGTGLGLSAVRGLAEQSGGSIALESTLGNGTCVALRFPVAPAGIAATQPREPKRLRESHGDAKVLLVEDQPELRAVTERALTSVGYRVLSCASADAAVRLFEAEPQGIDLLVTDVVMPGGNGPDLARRLRQLSPALPVLLTSGYAEEGALETAAALEPPPRFLAKPFSTLDLREAVRRALGL